MTRREFITGTAVSGSAAFFFTPNVTAAETSSLNSIQVPASAPAVPSSLPDLAPARWVWYPSERCLQNTFVLFRRVITVREKPRRAQGWIAADSRYLLEANGRRVQWGPPPADPRWAEADPVDLTDHLQPGPNVLGATVLFYGQGDGTWPMGKPGFLFRLEIEYADGVKETIVSDQQWQAHLARAWPPGHYKRWYLRSLQEEFDARLYPYGWTTADFTPDASWIPAMPLSGSPNKPAVSAGYYEYMLDVGSGPANAQLRARSIPLLQESLVPIQRLAESMWLKWRRPIREYFEFRTPNAYDVERKPSHTSPAAGEWVVELDGERGALLTFEFAEQVVGWPYFTIEAAAGTEIELLVQEAHQVGGPALLNTHFDSWTRFICRAGVNRFETFDFESLRWLQLHIHGARGTVRVRDVGVRRRQFPWPNAAQITCNEAPLQRLFDACVNTLHNCAQETCVDGMARERQQYSGDGAHQLHAIHLAFGENRLPARFLSTFSQGMTLDGFFLDCWPAYDRLARLIERQLHLTNWGPLLDHGIGFNFDCWHYYQYTGDLAAVREPYPRLLRFAQYLQSRMGPDGLLPVENLGIPSVWMDHVAYQRQRHKQCAFNLYAAAMLQHALAPLCRAMGDSQNETSIAAFGRKLLAAAIKRFWNAEHGLFINNLPWLTEEKQMRTCDRSLATAVLFDQCPEGRTEPAVRALAECPSHMGFSYPANATWRLWALAKAGRGDIIVKDLRERWAPMDSVRLNNTLQEDWQARPDSGQQWSHCAVAPLYLAYQALAGIRPLAPGFQRVEIWPQLGDLAELALTAHTVRGPIKFNATGQPAQRTLTLELPPGMEGELVVRNTEAIPLERSNKSTPAGFSRYKVPPEKLGPIGLKR